MTNTSRPPRGTRPANRRQLIVAAASDLFYHKGFAQVSMSDIANAVAIGPSALYRHFHSKNALFAAVIDEAMTRLERAVTTMGVDETAHIAANLAGATLIDRRAAVLWRREARHLPTEARRKHARRVRRLISKLATALAASRPLNPVDAELLARCALAVATSISYHHVALTNRNFHDLLTELVGYALDARVQHDTTNRRSDGIPSTSRREAILSTATELFSERGFAGVTMDDIGSAVGITGPSIYKHFPAKADILAAALFRGDEWLRIDLNRILAQTQHPSDAMTQLVRAYAGFTFTNPHLMHVLVFESSHLTRKDHRQARAAQHAYIAEWAHLAQQIHPTWDIRSTRIRVHAAQVIINEIGIDARARQNLAAQPTAIAIAMGIVGLGA